MTSYCPIFRVYCSFVGHKIIHSVVLGRTLGTLVHAVEMVIINIKDVAY